VWENSSENNPRLNPRENQGQPRKFEKLNVENCQKIDPVQLDLILLNSMKFKQIFFISF